jgi:hypothetical protein
MDTRIGHVELVPNASEPAATRPCDNCGLPGELNAYGFCPRCAELAQHADSYGTAVALDLLRVAVIAARAYASEREIAQTVTDALEAYES